jgi:hypothetical protein
MCPVGSRTHFTPKGVSIRARPGGYKHATTTWLLRPLLGCCGHYLVVAATTFLLQPLRCCCGHYFFVAATTLLL